MLRLIIADDERVIRETISDLIDWHSLGIELIGLCKDGIDAYNMILDESPDIVMTDIRMPGLTGLELVKAIVQTDLQTQFIILSGYEDFEYAREAMKYGIKHYLLKPCNEAHIIESIVQIGKECNLARKQAEEKEQQGIMLKTICQDAMYHFITEGIAIEDGQNLSTLIDSYSQYIDFSHKAYALRYIFFLKQEALSEILEGLSQFATEQNIHTSLYGLYVKNTLLLFYQDRIWSAKIKDICNKDVSDVQLDEVEHSNLLNLLEEAVGKVRRYDTINAIHDFRPIPIINSQNVLQRVKAVYKQLESANEAEIIDLCRELLSMLEGATEIEFLKLLSGSISIHFSAIDAYSSAEVAEFMMKLNLMNAIEEVQQMAKELIEHAEKELCRALHGYGILTEQIMAYVDEHLSDPNLTLKKIAERHLYMNVDYVSKQFKKSAGKNFSQYLTEQRVRRAKDLLVSADAGKVHNVAVQVGCENPQYFSQIFKKIAGMTPSKWAQQIQGNNLE